MAITTGHPGFEVTIEVDGTPLLEYNLEADDSDATPTPANTTLKYVEAPSGSEFSVRYLYRPPFNPTSDVQPDISLDGKFILVPSIDISPKDGCESYICGGGQITVDEKTYVQKFKFAELIIGGRTARHASLRILNQGADEYSSSVSEELTRQLAETGQIKLDFHFIANMQRVRAAEVPRLDFDELGAVSEKAAKATTVRGDAVNQTVGYVALVK